MDKSQIIALYNQDQRIEVEYPNARREVLPHIIRHVSTAGEEGAIIYSFLDETTVDAVIREQVEYFASIGQDFEWKLYDYDAPPDLKERLAAYGFKVGDAEAIMVLPIVNAPEFLLRPITADVRRITAPAQVQDVLRVKEQVWQGDCRVWGQYLSSTIVARPAQLSVYVAYVDEIPASAAWVYFPPHSQFASFWGGSTIEKYRRRGLYTALLAVRVQEARARGVNYLTVDASPMSRPILEKFGFEMIAYSYPCKMTGGSIYGHQHRDAQ